MSTTFKINALTYISTLALVNLCLPLRFCFVFAPLLKSPFYYFYFRYVCLFVCLSGLTVYASSHSVLQQFHFQLSLPSAKNQKYFLSLSRSRAVTRFYNFVWTRVREWPKLVLIQLSVTGLGDFVVVRTTI